MYADCVHNRHLELYPVGLGTDIGQPRPQDLLAFQNGGRGREVDPNKGGGGVLLGGYFRTFRVGICCWDPGTLSLYHSCSSSEFCYPILD